MGGYSSRLDWNASMTCATPADPEMRGGQAEVGILVDQVVHAGSPYVTSSKSGSLKSVSNSASDAP